MLKQQQSEQNLSPITVITLSCEFILH